MKPEITVVIHIASYSVMIGDKYYESNSLSNVGNWIEREKTN